MSLFKRLMERTKYDKKDEKLSMKRLDVCRNCPLFVLNIAGQAICSSNKTRHHKVTNDKVKGCGCVLAWKTSIDSQKCPAGEW